MQAVLDAEGETYQSESPHGTYKRTHPAYLIADRLESLEDAHANVVGTVLTRVDSHAHLRSGYADAEVYRPRMTHYQRG